MGRLSIAQALLQQNARPNKVAGMGRFGINPQRRLGLSVPAMRRIAKVPGHDHVLALELWDTGMPDARIVAGMLVEPAKLGSRQMDAWAKGFASWDMRDALRELNSQLVQQRLQGKARRCAGA